MGMKINAELPLPANLKAEYPLPKELAEIKKKRDAEIREIFEGKSDKFVVIVGPCSADNEDSVCDYVNRLAKSQREGIRPSDDHSSYLYKQTTYNRRRIQGNASSAGSGSGSKPS